MNWNDLLDEGDVNFNDDAQPVDGEFNVNFVTSRNRFGREIQRMTFLQNGQHTRSHYLDEEQAVDTMHEMFNFEVGKTYLIQYLTNYQYRSGQPFVYHEDTQLEDHVYSAQTERDLYGRQAIEGADLHIYAIVVEEMRGE